MTGRERELREGVELERRIFSRPSQASDADRERYAALRQRFRLPPAEGHDWPRDRLIRIWDRETFRCYFCRNVKHESERAHPFGVNALACCLGCKRNAEAIYSGIARRGIIRK